MRDLFKQACLTILATAVVLRLWRKDLMVPFNYWGDTIFELALTKSIADGGWVWFIERLGRPFGLEIVAFPQNLTFSSIVMKGIALFTAEPGLILNLFWLLTIVMTSVVCHVALRFLSVSPAVSLVMSTLYALLPHTLYRNIAHISLTYIFVPIVAAFAVKVLASSRAAADNTEDNSKIPQILLFASCAAIGFDYIYTAFFGCFFLLAAGAAGSAFARRWLPLKQVLPVIGIIGACAAVNVTPSFDSWQKYGLPPNMDYKFPAEAEVYGLKIRHVISPLLGQRGPGQPVNFPLENENRFAALGVVGATGFLLALGCGLIGAREGTNAKSWSAGILTIMGTLLATVGGFGAIFNLLVTPDIRAYNRIIVFIAFFAFLVFGLQFDAIRLKIERLDVWGKHAWRGLAVAAALFCVLLIGLVDQGQAAVQLVARYTGDEAQSDEEREMVRRLELTLPHVRNVYQLPETSFPPDRGIERMQPYDHGRPYLWSQQIQWSWPSFSQRRAAWTQAIGGPLQDEFITNLVISDFDGIWLDRFGYKPSDLAAIEAKLAAQAGAPVATSRNARYLFYSLQAQREWWLRLGTKASRQQAREALMEPIQIQFERGFHEEEVASVDQKHRWSQRVSTLSVMNHSARPRRAEFRAKLGANRGGIVSIKSQSHSVRLAITDGSNDVRVPLELAPHSRRRVEFSFEGSRIHAPADPRSMYFSIINYNVQEVSN